MIPRATFWLGGLTGALALIPLLAWTFSAFAAPLGIAEAAPAWDLLLLAAVFTGLPALLSSGGVARLVAHRTAERSGGFAAGLARAAVPMAAIGAGAALILCVTQMGTPETPLGWAIAAAAGVPAGLVAGVAVALVAVARQRRFAVVTA